MFDFLFFFSLPPSQSPPRSTNSSELDGETETLHKTAELLRRALEVRRRRKLENKNVSCYVSSRRLTLRLLGRLGDKDRGDALDLDRPTFFILSVGLSGLG